MPVITLTTDFGLTDWFVGTIKGVILRLARSAQIVDITHEVPPGDIRAGAFALAASFSFFPKGTIHVAVVDPGVGSERSAIAVRTMNYFFVGPDNGVLSLALASEKIRFIRRVDDSRYFLSAVSRTFHGRDVFAPVAAHLSGRLPIARLGPAAKDFVRLKLTQPITRPNSVHGEVIYIDRFGNAMTNIRAEHLNRWPPESIRILARQRRRPIKFAEFYNAVPQGEPLALINSVGYLEIAVSGGDAAKRLRLKLGSPVVVRGND